MDLAKLLSSLGGGSFVEEAQHRCLSDLGSGAGSNGGDGVGKKQDATAGRLALWLQEQDFQVVQLSWPGKEKRWRL